MKICPNCGAQVDDNSLFCTECGKPIPQGNVCSHCGASVNSNDSFCQNCGNKIDGQPVITSSAPEQRKCPHCGALVNKDGLFCENCGKNMSDGDSAPIYQERDPYEEDSVSRNKLILPIATGLLVLTLVGGSWWFYKSSYSPNGENLQEVADSISFGNAETSEAYSEKDIQEMKEFLEKLYKEGMDFVGVMIKKSYIKNNATDKALKFLNENGYECLLFDEKAGCGGQIWVKSIEHIDANLFEICISSYWGQGIYSAYKVKLSVAKEDGSYKIDSIEKGETEYEGELITESSNTDTDWLQGHWVYEQGSYKGHFIIQGDKIIQYSSMNPEHDEATFKVEGDEIRARLIDGMDLVVKIDFANQSIDYGDGCWMHKVSE